MTAAITEDRVTGIKRLLWVALACAVVLLVAAGLISGRNGQYAVTLAVVAVLVAAAAGFTLRALPARDARARRGAITTGILMVLLAVPAVQIWVGIVMAIAGVGLLFVVFSKEVDR